MIAYTVGTILRSEGAQAVVKVVTGKAAWVLSGFYSAVVRSEAKGGAVDTGDEIDIPFHSWWSTQGGSE